MLMMELIKGRLNLSCSINSPKLKSDVIRNGSPKSSPLMIAREITNEVEVSMR